MAIPITESSEQRTEYDLLCNVLPNPDLMFFCNNTKQKNFEWKILQKPEFDRQRNSDRGFLCIEQYCQFLISA